MRPSGKDTKRTMLVQFKLSPALLVKLEVLQVVTGRGIGELIEEACANEMSFWCGDLVNAVNAGEVSPEVADLSVFDLTVVPVGRELRRQRARRGRLGTMVTWRKP